MKFYSAPGKSVRFDNVARVSYNLRRNQLKCRLYGAACCFHSSCRQRSLLPKCDRGAFLSRAQSKQRKAGSRRLQKLIAVCCFNHNGFKELIAEFALTNESTPTRTEMYQPVGSKSIIFGSRSFFSSIIVITANVVLQYFREIQFYFTTVEGSSARFIIYFACS